MRTRSNRGLSRVPVFLSMIVTHLGLRSHSDTGFATDLQLPLQGLRVRRMHLQRITEHV